MKKAKLLIFAILTLTIVLGVSLTACADPMKKQLKVDDFTLNGWEKLAKYGDKSDIKKLKVSDFIMIDDLSTDTYLYSGDQNGEASENANPDGWFPTLIDNFDVTYDTNRGLNPEIWATSRHDMRTKSPYVFHKDYSSYWCDEMVSVNNGIVSIKAQYEKDHKCAVCNGNGIKKGRFTGGFETRAEVLSEGSTNKNRGYNSNILWGQAFGYFETEVKFPTVDGMWSAFWLQSNEMREIGNDGRDGTEIDIFESAFGKRNNEMSRMGHALLWNGYGQSGKVQGAINDLGDNNLYDGAWHKFSLLWTPECYIFFIDGIATWATDAGGISTVPEFIRFTCEIDQGDGYGPHGEYIGKFPHDKVGEFEVNYVRVYQNSNYLSHIAESVDGKPYSKDNNYESHFKSDYDKAN